LRLLFDLLVLVGGVLVDDFLHLLGALFVLFHGIPGSTGLCGGGLGIGLRCGRLVAAGAQGQQAEQGGSGSHGGTSMMMAKVSCCRTPRTSLGMR
jgi:hypothetical protein